jgi:hypothetical protein
LLRARQKLGKFRIEGRLSNGPIAAVYQAYDSIHGIRVALKIPHPSSMDELFLADFKREARLAPLLEHPNILPIRDASYIDGHFVIVMPLGERSLGERMARRMSVDTAMDLTEQMLAAVAHAHDCNVIHCDIKPDNFILFEGGELKLTDFAFSKLAVRTIKASGSGTLGYLAPEQALGRPMFQSDVFSLGLVTHELFTGYLPEWPFRWPAAGHSRLKAKLKPSLIPWLRRALEFRAQDRFQSAVSMYREFRRLRNGGGRRSNGDCTERGGAASQDWHAVRFKQFQKQFKTQMGTRHACRHCTGPVAEAMQACPWCGAKDHLKGHTTDFPATCPRCTRGVKLDWEYCAWCYGAGFEVETTRRYADRRYTAKCSNTKCKGPHMPFMRYCPWCRTKVKRRWHAAGPKQSCPSCQQSVAADYWSVCPWCTKPLGN